MNGKGAFSISEEQIHVKDLAQEGGAENVKTVAIVATNLAKNIIGLDRRYSVSAGPFRMVFLAPFQP